MHVQTGQQPPSQPPVTTPLPGGPLADTVANPVAITATNPPTIAPIVGKGPVTEHAPLNMAIGAGVVGATQAGFMAVTGGGQVLATSVFLNLISQLVKDVKWFPEHKGLIVVMLLVSFVIGYFIFYQGDVGNSFINMANSTMQAILNYKGDKAAGLNAMAPVPDHLEFAAGSAMAGGLG